jgi:uncharacterized repeat protein (TIGR01451 family)
MSTRSRPPGSPTLDLTTDDSLGVIDGVVFETADVQPAGTGAFNAFEQVQNNGFEQGVNTDGAKQFDTKSSADSNHSILLAQVPIVIGDGTNGTQDGVAYREFLLDINEPNGNSKPFLSLDSLQIWQEEAGNLTGFTPNAGFAGAHSNNLVYDLDAGGDKWIGLDASLSHAHGNSDIAILVPDSLFVNNGTDRFLYVYSAFGAQAGWDAGGSFEELGLATPNGPNVPTNAMSISKTASAPGNVVDHVGEVVSYTIQVSDVGNTNLTHVAVTDPLVTGMTRGTDVVGNNDNVLNPGEIWSFTATHTVTQADLDAGLDSGVLSNTATATSDQAAPVSASVAVPVIAAPVGPHATMVISPTPATATAGGEVIDYAVAVTNDGTVNLTELIVADNAAEIFLPQVLNGGGFNVGDANQDGITNVGETWQFTATQTITQDEIDNRNAAGIPTVDPSLAHVYTLLPLYDQLSIVEFGSSTVPIVQNPHVTLGKTATLADGGTAADNAGDVINYAIGLANDGNMDLTNPLVSDPTVSGLAQVLSGGFNAGDTNHDGELSVGETWRYTAAHTVTQAEIDNGGVVNPALAIANTASATTDQGASSTATASVAVAQHPHVTLAKTATLADGGAVADSAGDVINYAIGLTNDGNMTLTNPAVSDPSVSDLAAVTAGGFNVGDTNHDGKLSLGETWRYTADHTVTQAQIDNGGVVDPTLAIINTASATTDQGASATASASVGVAQNPSLALAKNGTFNDANSNGLADPGETIGYSFTETNTGNMTLDGVTVSDGGSGVTVTGGPIASLAPGAADATTFTGTYTITQADIDAGFKDNTATATSDNATSAPATAHVVLPQSAHMSLGETAADANSPPAAGDALVYTFSLTNDGNVTLHDPTVSDTATGGVAVATSGGNIVGDANNNLLFDPGETWTFTGSRTLSADDVANGVADTSTAAALGPQNQPASATASFTFHA